MSMTVGHLEQWQFYCFNAAHYYGHPDAAAWLRIDNCKAFISKVNNGLATPPLLGESTAVEPRPEKYFKDTDDCKKRLKLRATGLALFTRSSSFTFLPAETLSEQCSTAVLHCSSWECGVLLELCNDEHSIPHVAWMFTSICNKSCLLAAPLLLWLWKKWATPEWPICLKMKRRHAVLSPDNAASIPKPSFHGWSSWSVLPQYLVELTGLFRGRAPTCVGRRH